MVAIDVDGTLANVAGVLCSIYGWKYDELSQYALPAQDVPWRQVFTAAKPYPGAAAAVRRIAQRFPAIYLTAREPVYRDVSRRWLDRHGFPRLPIWFAGDDKALMARNLGVRVAIDDAPDNVAALAAAGIPTLVPAQPYNRGLVPRFDSWDEAPDMVAGIWPGGATAYARHA